MPTEVTPAVYGMAVIILLQLSQFFFAWKKDQRGEPGAEGRCIEPHQDDDGGDHEAGDAARRVDDVAQAADGALWFGVASVRGVGRGSASS